MSDEEINEFERQLSNSNIYTNAISIEDVVLSKKNKSILDYCFSILYWGRYNAARIFRRWKR